MHDPELASLHPLPNLVLLGAQKCGTSSLHNYLRAHREIFMSTPLKEAGIYLPLEAMQGFYNDCYGVPIASKQQLLHEHMLQGYNGQRYFGESPTHYSHGDVMRRERLAEVLHHANPEMRFIYVMRNPFARIASVYAHWLREGRLQTPLHEYLRSPRFQDDLLTTCYHYQLQPILETFGPQQVLALQFESLVQEPRETLARIYAFLGLEAKRGDFPRRFPPHNVTAGSLQRRVAYSQTAYEAIMEKVGPDIEALKGLLPTLDWDTTATRWVREDAESLDFGQALAPAKTSLLARARKRVSALLHGKK